MVVLSRWMQGPWRFIAIALLMIVVVHAAAPVAQPLDRSSGSAFSAATSDVTLTCSERAAIAKTALPDKTAPPPFGAVVQVFPMQATAACLPHRAFTATGPPPVQTSFHPLNPRAPPAA